MDSNSKFNQAIMDGDLSEVQRWYPLTDDETKTDAMSLAGTKNNLDIIKWLWSRRIEPNGSDFYLSGAYMSAIDHHHFEIAAWLWNHSRFQDELRITPKLAEDNIEILIDILGSDNSTSASLAEAAFDIITNSEIAFPNHQLKILKFLAQYDVYPDDRAILYSIKNGKFDILEWLLGFYTLTRREFIDGVRFGGADALDIFDKLDYSVPDVDDVYNIAVEIDNADIVRWLIDHEYELPDDPYLDAIGHNAIDVFICLFYHDYPLPENAYAIARFEDAEDIVVWLRERDE
jgi:hypothetical protein